MLKCMYIIVTIFSDQLSEMLLIIQIIINNNIHIFTILIDVTVIIINYLITFM